MRANRVSKLGLFGGSGSKKLFLLFLPRSLYHCYRWSRRRRSAFLQILLPFVVWPGPFPLLLHCRVVTLSSRICLTPLLPPSLSIDHPSYVVAWEDSIFRAKESTRFTNWLFFRMMADDLAQDQDWAHVIAPPMNDRICYLCDHVESEVEYLLCDVHSASEKKE